MNFLNNIADMMSDFSLGDGDSNLESDSIAFDLDGDGMEDSFVQGFDTDGDGLEDSWLVETDTDGDGVADKSIIMTDEEFNHSDAWLSQGSEFEDVAVCNSDFDSDSVTVDNQGTPMDLNGDGINETIYQELDTDGDGAIDTVTMEADMDGDGVVDSAAIFKDLDGDGIADQTSYLEVADSNGDGVQDTWAIQTDHDGDGVADESMMVADSDGDGMADTRLAAGTGYNPWTGNTHDTSEYPSYNTYYVDQYGEVHGSDNWEDPYHYQYDEAGNTYYQLQ